MTTALTPTPAPKAPVILWDLLLTIGLIVFGVIGGISLGLVGLLLSFAGEGCVAACEAQFNVGFLVAVLAPAVIVVITSLFGIVRLVQRKLAFWFPLAGCVLGGAASALGFWIALSAADANVL